MLQCATWNCIAICCSAPHPRPDSSQELEGLLKPCSAFMAALTHCHFVGPRGGRAKLKIAQLALKQRHWQQAWGEDGKAAYNIDWNACIYDKKGCQVILHDQTHIAMCLTELVRFVKMAAQC